MAVVLAAHGISSLFAVMAVNRGNDRLLEEKRHVAVVMAGLLPILLGSGTGSEIMQRIAAPMVGGMITAPLLSLFVIPAAYLLLRRRQPGGTPAEGG